MTEEWKPISNFEDLYIVSSAGNVRRIAKGGPAKIGVNRTLSVDPDGYVRVGLSKSSEVTTAKVHRLVADAFLGPLAPLMTVNHIDGNKSNNHVENLEIVSRGENIRHAFKVIKTQNVRGENNPRATLTEEQVIEIRRRLAEGQRGVDVAKAFGTNKYTISTIKQRKSWTHI